MSARMSTISAIVPTRDRAGMLADALASLEAQTRRPDEIIVVDDGSTDDTDAVLERFGPALRILRTPGVGPSAARNAGLAAARGSLVHFLDSDDTLAPEAYAALGALLDAVPETDLALGRLRVAILPGGTAGHTAGWSEDMHGVLIGTALFRRELLAGLGGFDAGLRFGEDLDLFRRIEEAGWRRSLCDRVVLEYRRHGDNMTNDTFAAKRAMFDVLRRAQARRKEQTG